MNCERCGRPTTTEGHDLHDYCAECSRNLCQECMQGGCCGHQPALSGMNADFGPDDEELSDQL